MRIKRTDAGNMPELDKAEVRCLMDAKAIIEAADAIQGGDSVTMRCGEGGDSLIVRPLTQEIEFCARAWGAKHFDESGKLKGVVRRKVDPIDLGPDPPSDLTDEALPKKAEDPDESTDDDCGGITDEQYDALVDELAPEPAEGIPSPS